MIQVDFLFPRENNSSFREIGIFSFLIDRLILWSSIYSKQETFIIIHSCFDFSTNFHETMVFQKPYWYSFRTMPSMCVWKKFEHVITFYLWLVSIFVSCLPFRDWGHISFFSSQKSFLSYLILLSLSLKVQVLAS